MCRICCSPPGNLGNHAGRLAVDKPFTGSPKVLLITTQGRPAHLTCGQTIARILIPRPRSVSYTHLDVYKRQADLVRPLQLPKFPPQFFDFLVVAVASLYKNSRINAPRVL